TVAATDQLGNVSTAVGTATYTLDRSLPNTPSVVLSSPASSPGNVTSPQFTVTDPDTSPGGITYVCSVAGKTSVPSSAITCGPTTTVDLSGAGRDGTYILSVTAVDAAGNASPVAGTASYALDTTRPGPPNVTLTSPASSPGNRSTATFSVSSPTDASPGGVTYACTVTRTSPLPVTAVAASSITCGTTTTVDFSAIGDGSYTVSVIATDRAGNVGTGPGTATYVLDTGAPPAPVIVVPIASTKLPAFGISDADPTVTFTCQLVSPRGRVVFPTGADATCPADGTFDTTPYVDGDYVLTVTATDPAGNPSQASATWTRDTTEPPAPTVTAPASPSNDSTPTFTISDTEATAILNCILTGPNSSAVTAFTGACPTDGTFTLTGDGVYTLTVTASDQAGNVQATSASASYTLDTGVPAAPAVTRTSPVGSPNNVSAVRFSVVETDSSPGGVTLTCTVTGPTTVPASAVSCGATTLIDLSGPGRDGSYTLSVIARDLAGNVSPAGTGEYTLDTVAPPAPDVALSMPATSPGHLTIPAFAVTDTESSPGMTFQCTVTGATAVPASAVACGSTTSVDLSGPGRDGAYTLSVTATDAAGNTSPATTAGYTMDTVAPFAPVVSLASATRSSDRSPLWTWQFGVNDTATDLDTATCIVTGPHGWTLTTTDCHRHYAPQLGGGDGTYTVTVVLTDEAGNEASQVSPEYTLDSTAPIGASVTLRRPGFVGLSRHPVWKIVAPPTSTLECTLLAGNATNGTPVAPAATCPDPATFSLVGQPDGMYTLRVVAVDSAHNKSAPASASYILAPSPPKVLAPRGNGTLAVWSVEGNPDDLFSCTLLRGGKAVAGPHHCGARPTYDMSKRPSGTYVLSVVQIGAEGAQSAPASASWFWVGHVPTNPGTDQTNGNDNTTTPPPPSDNSNRNGDIKKAVKPASVLDQLPSNTRQLVQRVKREVGGTVPPFVHPNVHPNRVTDHITSAVQNAVHVVGSAGGGTGFPLMLLGLVLAFLVAQNRIDRRDPKLALASIAADDMVEFGQPPSRRERP
ncbi:MAG: hypothetical protein JO246_06600, partial [Frankiaceae bacterium]|nr:hypothetical protein [Frankiaceae bacterium]